MTFTESLGRIQQIQSTLTQFDPAVAAPRTAPAGAQRGSAIGAAGSTTFADTLASVLGPEAASGLGASAGVGGVDRAQPPAGGVTGEAVAAAAKRYVGVPYVWGGTDPAKGMDCSGFVQRVYGDLGIDLPRVVGDQMKRGTEVPSLAQARPGDLLVSHGHNHIAIYLGDGKAIDAPMPGKTIQVRDAWEARGNLTTIRRIVPQAPPNPSGSGALSRLSVPSATASGPATAALDATQRHYARVIVDEVRARGLPAQAAVDAISTALQESSLRMYWNPKVPGSQALAPDPSARGTDGHSVGLFQQQVDGSRFSWGTVSDAMDPRTSTRMFLDRLTALPGWESMPVAAADQAVQRSAYPTAYAKWESTARQIVSELYGAGVR
ncbi:NlpC/P60 family protein [Terrabacter sp. NPDC080008]|uniref:C40 family peptidase n=1 Tax=Terrabacter sp. NPDC080008 TaxID=3155176 RepID=UPI00344E17D7